MTGFAERDKDHAEHLERVRRALHARGFEVEDAGWERRPEAERQELIEQWPKALWRWWPDLLATRGPFGRMLVDAKAELRDDTANYSIELAALALYAMIEARMRTAVVVVFPGGACDYARDLNPVSVQTRGNGGSGTAFVLVRKDSLRTFEQVFGPVEAEGGAAS
jgi:hypothetical protein